MRIGIDLDNTIICYDQLFYWLAAERSLVPPGSPGNPGSPGGIMTKSQVRDHLRATGREEEWTRLQGEAYGPRIREALPFPGVVDFISHCRREAVDVFIISHKTRHPYLGERHDLHAAALGWLEHHGFFTPAVGLSRGDVFLEETKSGKLERIARQRCTHFIDDLPEILFDPEFPRLPLTPHRFHFDPSPSPGRPMRTAEVERVCSWARMTSLLFQEVTS